MRTFVNLRQYALSQSITDPRIEDIRKMLLLHIENTDNKFSEHDQAINQIIQALNNLIEQPPKKKRPMGFVAMYDKKYDDE
jgi:hypothetical protein